jgi:predicted porin
MKKVIIAVAIGALSSVASAQVSLSGKVSVWQDSTKVGTVRENSMWQEPTNNFAIGVQEKLGNGLTARATVETSLQGNTFDGGSTRIGDRQSTVGIASSVGSIDLGRNVHSQFLAIAMNDAFSTIYGSVAGDVHNLRGLRFGDASFVNITAVKGFNVSWDRSQTPGAEASAASVGGSFGPVNATIARYEQLDEISTVAGANAAFGSTTVYYSRSDNKGAVASKGDLVGVRHQMGAYAAKASYGRTNTDVKAYNVGLDYALSKRTEVGIAYRNVDLVASANDVKQIGLGLTHRF